MKSAREADELPDDTRVIAISLDGANVRLNEPGPKRGRPDERPDKQEDEELEPTCFKNAMVGTVAYFGEIAEGKHSPGYLHQTCIGQMPEDKFLTFKERFEEEVDHCLELCATSSRPIDRLLLLDGGTNLHGYLDKNPDLKYLPRLIDFFHATEHLGKATEALFGKKSKAGRKWAETYRHILKTDVDGVTKLRRSLAYYEQKQKLSKQRQKDLATEITFFRRGGKYMTYADFRARGWPIGSGVVEAACKSIVKQRLCRSGMRWSREGGQPIMTIRTLVCSGRWQQAWAAAEQIQHPEAA
jgi:hypothetical protein